ncbi:unnamed protein product [Didymodactylos carnosus]|uniref:Uncharacterized protein n=1 Tax=Didymodactylos carnosus TaxID=1234261 RepID=A0A8S2ERE2_9BILA|nr:unnamed protein product [Didymodactylos carnosus]CAF4027435.1 unnamed protein product [Didymodactylos carnosus]
MNAIARASELIGTFQNQTLIHIDYVSIDITCQFNRFNCTNSTFDSNNSSCIVPQSEIETYAVPFLVGSITNIEMNSTMLMTVLNFRPGLYVQATAVNSETLNITIERLPLPLPPSIGQALIKHILVRSVSIINPILLKHPLLLPVEVVPYFPHPSSHLFNYLILNNSQSQNVGYGYIDITSNEILHFDVTKHTQSNYKQIDSMNTSRYSKSCSKIVHANPVQLFDNIDKTLFVDNIRSTYPLGIYLLMYESEYDNIQNTERSIARSGLQMSLYALLTTSYLKTTIITKHHHSTLNYVSAQCMNTTSFPSNLAYYSLLQDSVTGIILAINFMCSDSKCEQCQFQQEFYIDI